MENLFISESSLGYHYNKAIEEVLKADFMSFTFYPAIKTKLFESIFDVELFHNKRVMLNFKNVYHHIESYFSGDIVSYILSLKKKYIFIGYDLDRMGELMADILNYLLIQNGFNEENIFRIPLCDFGYDFTEIGFSEFSSFEKTMQKLQDIYLEQKLIKITKQGFYKNFILKEIFYLNEKEFEKLNNKTNSLTYVTKFLLKE